MITEPNYLKIRAVVIDQKNMVSVATFPQSVPATTSLATQKTEKA